MRGHAQCDAGVAAGNPLGHAGGARENPGVRARPRCFCPFDGFGRRSVNIDVRRDLLEIRDPRSGDTYLYPFSKTVVPEVRIADGYLTIDPPIEAEPGEEEPD